MRYNLIYDGHEIGEVLPAEKTISECSGIYVLNDQINWDVEELRLVQSYIDYSVIGDHLMLSDEDKWHDFVQKEEHKYYDLIYSGLWFLQAENGERLQIDAPIFGVNNEFAWMWSKDSDED